MSTQKYTDADVRKLVKEVKEAFDWVTNHNGNLTQFTGHTRCIVDALKPFLLDPEEELLVRVNTIRNTSGNFDDRSRQIIAAVREHDAKLGRST